MHISPAIYEQLNLGSSAAEAERAPWLPSVELRPFFPLYVQRHYMEPRLPAFRALLLQGVQLEWPDTAAPGSSWYNTDPIRQIVRAAKYLRVKQRQFAAILRARGQPWPDVPEDLVGRPYHAKRWVVVGRPETDTNLRANFYYGLLRATLPDLDAVTSVVDVGGGFGAFASVIAVKHPAMRVTVVELPYACVLAGYCIGVRQRGAIVVDDDPGSRLTARPPWSMVRAGTADLLVNTASFQHMPEAALRYYFELARHMGIPRIWSLNREAPRNPSEVAYLPIALDSGYVLERREALREWRDDHFVHVLRRG